MTAFKMPEASDPRPASAPRSVLLADVVHDRIRRAIVDGQYPDGARLPGENDLARQFLADLLQRRGDHLARAAPVGPEIHQHGGIAVQHIGLKACIGHVDGRHFEFSFADDHKSAGDVNAI